MNQLTTQGIILSRTDFGEADRIITVLTADQGKLRLMAKGVRKIKSKLAGGIELFSVSDLTYIKGRGEVGTLISSRLVKHYGHIVRDINRVQLGYELIKLLNKITEDQPEATYFDLLEQTFKALDDHQINLDLITLWFAAQLLKFGGHQPNLQTDTTGNKLQPDQKYSFDFDHMSLATNKNGNLTAADIKFLRLMFSATAPKTLNQIQNLSELMANSGRLIQTMLQTIH
jgi:DNA repair protein RecO (recombination protein O)